MPIAINFRTGTSVEDNLKLLREIIESYPKKEEKAIVSHDWGSVIMWRLYNELANNNVKKLFVMSVSNKIAPNYELNPLRLYQWPMLFFDYIPDSLLPDYMVGIECPDKIYFTPKSTYYYNLRTALRLSTVGENMADKLNDNIKIYHISSFVDKSLGFVDESLLSEPLKYEGHWFYIENARHINNQIINFLGDNTM